MHRDVTTGQFVVDPAPQLLACQQCGSTFRPHPNMVRLGYAKFCSRACRDLGHRRRIERTCAACGTRFEVRPSELLVRAALYCGMACSQARHAVHVTPLADRFWASVQKTETCWLWTRSDDGHGYGHIGEGHRGGRHLKAPRVALSLALGAPIPKGFFACHVCDTPSCVRNDDAGVYYVRGILRPRFGHLFLGTRADNMADAVTKGRIRRGTGSPVAALTDDLVRAMRAAVASGESLRSIARRFSVSQETGRKAILGITWKHVA